MNGIVQYNGRHDNLGELFPSIYL